MKFLWNSLPYVEALASLSLIYRDRNTGNAINVKKRTRIRD
jgi:hypothetical protein